MVAIAERYLEELSQTIATQAPPGLICSVYVYGSVLTDRFSPDRSDIDILFVLEDTSDRVSALQKLRGLCSRCLPAEWRLDTSAMFRSEVQQRVPYRPYINDEIGGFGRLIYGVRTIEVGGQLDWQDLLDALVFDTREYRRIYLGVAARCWQEIIERDIRVFFMRLSQLGGHFEPSPIQAMEVSLGLFPNLKQFESTFRHALTESSDGERISANMETLEILKAFVEGQIKGGAGR